MDESLRSRLRVAALVTVAGLALFGLLRWAPWSAETPAEADSPSAVLDEPTGILTEPPAAFRWEAVPGAEFYRLTVADQDTIWPLAVREVKTSSFYFTEAERGAWGASRKYEWSIEAIGGNTRSVLARGTAYFAVVPAGAPTPETSER